MNRIDLSSGDYSESARTDLDKIINEPKEEVEMESLDEAVSGQAFASYQSQRETTRVLFITQDTSILNQSMQSLDGYIDISELFDEVHILILRPGIRTTTPVLRVSKNVWVYTATAKYWWWTPVVGYGIAKDQLAFAEGFRPDLIVARDPFECGLLGYVLGSAYDRPTQLHILKNYEDPDFTSERSNRWRKLIAKFVIPRYRSVRTLTSKIQNWVEQKYEIIDLTTLPRLNLYERIAKLETSIDLKEKYRPFIFVMLYVGKLDHESTLHKTLNAAQAVLKNRHVGLVVIGDGPARKEFMNKTEALGIKEQVVFERSVKDIIGYLKAAHILIITDKDEQADESAIRGAAVGTPLLLSHTEVRDDLFVDGESAMICDAEDQKCFSSKLGTYLNDVELRKKIGKEGQRSVLEKLHEDPAEYRKVYRETIEKAILLDEALE